MRRPAARAGLLVAGAATLWSSAAAASGHGLDALDAAFGFLLLMVALAPWTLSWWLFIGWEHAPRVVAGGTLTSAIAAVLVGVGGLAPVPLYLALALLPGAAHLARGARARTKPPPALTWRSRWPGSRE
ncbi:MAG TPA: hypothetical protein VKZ18_08845 [Polyangia bacterium]|nr:hypothetical protein [Polyangia bacterium]